MRPIHGLSWGYSASGIAICKRKNSGFFRPAAYLSYRFAQAGRFLNQGNQNHYE